MRNVVLNVLRKILQTYYIEKSYSTAYFNITKLLHALEVLENDVKCLYFEINILKNAITPYFLVENKSLCFLVELSKQNRLQLNMSKNIKTLRQPH